VIEVFRGYDPGAASAQFIDNRVDIGAIHRQKEINRFISNHRQPEHGPLLLLRMAL